MTGGLAVVATLKVHGIEPIIGRFPGALIR